MFAMYMAGVATPHVEVGKSVGTAVFLSSVGFVFGFIGFATALIGLMHLAARHTQLCQLTVVQALSEGILIIYVFHLVAMARVQHLFSAPRPALAALSDFARPDVLFLCVAWPIIIVSASIALGWLKLRFLTGLRVNIAIRKVAHG